MRSIGHAPGGRLPVACGWHVGLPIRNFDEMWCADALDDPGVEAAIAEARRRWGPTGAISLADQFPRSRLLVGELRGGRFWIQGRGSTWEAAFADADARAIRASRRKAAR